ncbi:MAG: macro domain-containing protein [Leptospirales bacterium]|nr:macro domain-containing protein [Leptospirales bacterium]
MGRSLGARTIAFPAISTGAYGFPPGSCNLHCDRSRP